MQTLLDNESIPSIPISEFDSIVSEKGWCDKIGYGADDSFYGWTSMYGGPYYTKSETPKMNDDLYVKEDNLMVYYGVVFGFSETYGVQIDVDGHYASRKSSLDEIDDTPTTYFKVPKLSAYIIQKENIPVIGNGITLGFTDGSSNYGFSGVNSSPARTLLTTGADYGSTVGSVHVSDDNPNKTVGIVTDPTKSGIISDLSNDSFAGRVMIQLFNSTTDTAVATCNQVLADVSALNQGDYVIYYDSADITDHSHAFPYANTLTNHQWYRIYKSGWIEQGGIFTNSIDEIIILPVTMSSAVYNITTEIYNGQIGWASLNWSVSDITPTQFRVYYDGSDNDPQGFSWEIKGFMLDYSLSSTI